jgi:hypothetical protein
VRKIDECEGLELVSVVWCLVSGVLRTHDLLVQDSVLATLREAAKEDVAGVDIKLKKVRAVPFAW